MMSGTFGLGSNQSYVEWSRQHFRSMKIGGVWAVPRSGLVFTRTGETTLALTEVMPHVADMPMTPRELFDYQAGDFQAIQGYMKLAGVTCHDTTDTFEHD